MKELRGQGRQLTRKEIYMNNKMVRLFLRMGRQPKKKKKYPKCHNVKDKELVRKMEKLGDCFYI